jgi:hypothetical protein
LGFIISRDGISKDSRFTAAIRDFQHPMSYLSQKRLRAYTLLQVLGIFIADSFAIMRKRSGLLRDLTRKDGYVELGAETRRFVCNAKRFS